MFDHCNCIFNKMFSIEVIFLTKVNSFSQMRSHICSDDDDGEKVSATRNLHAIKGCGEKQKISRKCEKIKIKAKGNFQEVPPTHYYIPILEAIFYNDKDFSKFFPTFYYHYSINK